MLLAASLGCGTIDPKDDSGTASDGGTAEAGTAEAGTAEASTATATGASEGDSTGHCSGECFADFPCTGSEARCVDPLTIEVYVDVPCDEGVCLGSCSCQGSSCMLQGQEPCPAGTWCLDANLGASCQAPEGLCGGPDGQECAADELCEYATGLCPACVDDPVGCGPGSPVGVCVPRPPPDEACPELDPEGNPFDPQCGCDGVYYASECERRQAGVPWANDPLMEPGVCG